jgi:hypothetical protein
MPVLGLLLAIGTHTGEAVIQRQHMEAQVYMSITVFMIRLGFIVLGIEMDMS